MDAVLPTRLERMNRLFTPEEMQKIQKSHVMLFGLGGVGSYAAEAVARCGVGHLTIVDHDAVSITNMNRQLPALESTVGCQKTAVVEARLRDAAPDMQITSVDAFDLPDQPVPIPQDATVVLDAIDTIAAKVELIRRCKERAVPIISCMGMGNRRNPTLIQIGDLFSTSGCPLCRTMRHELRKLGITNLRCVYSTEKSSSMEGRTIGSVAYVPSVAGLYLAYEAIQTILSVND